MSRRRSREIGSISLSALDLFCCALGAFIILTAVTLQYVPNLSPEELYEKLKQAEDRAKSAEAENESLKEQVKTLEESLKANRSDIMIAVDTTASMGEEVRLIRSEIGKLVLILRKLSNDTRIGFIDYKDSRCGEPVPFRVQPLTKIDDAGLQQINAFLDQMEARTNCTSNDEPEALYEAFQRSVASDWQVQPENRVILLIGDNPPYDEQQSALIEGARQFAAQGGVVSTRFTSDTRSPRKRDPSELETIKAYYGRVASAGGGIAITSDEGGFALSILLSIAK